jgi:hypothetical protein
MGIAINPKIGATLPRLSRTLFNSLAFSDFILVSHQTTINRGGQSAANPYRSTYLPEVNSN